MLSKLLSSTREFLTFFEQSNASSPSPSPSKRTFSSAVMGGTCPQQWERGSVGFGVGRVLVCEREWADMMEVVFTCLLRRHSCSKIGLHVPCKDLPIGGGLEMARSSSSVEGFLQWRALWSTLPLPIYSHSELRRKYVHWKLLASWQGISHCDHWISNAYPRRRWFWCRGGERIRVLILIFPSEVCLSDFAPLEQWRMSLLSHVVVTMTGNAAVVWLTRCCRI